MQDAVAQFAALFAGLERAYSKLVLTDKYKTVATGQKREAKNWWVREPLTEDVYRNHINGVQWIGVGPLTDRGTASFGVIDIDDYNWTPARLTALCTRIESLGLPLVPARSKSGGVRLYLFCWESEAKLVRRYLKFAAASIGFSSAEIFPSSVNLIQDRGDTGNAVTLPYFNGNSSICKGFWKDKELTLEEFVQRAEENKCDTTALNHLPVTIQNQNEFADGPPCLQQLAVQGSGDGMRNSVLSAIAVYLRLKFGDGGPQQHLDEANQRIINPPLPSQEVVDVLKSSTKKHYFYQCNKEPLSRYCNKDLCLTRKFGIGNGLPAMNLDISNITKFKTKPPIWIVTINNVRVEMESEDLMQVQRFAKVCMEELHLVPNLKADRLRMLINKALEKVEELDAPPEASEQGQIEELFERFLASKPPEQREDLIAGRPYYENGLVYFRSEDFKTFLEIERVRSVDMRKVYRVLSAYNVKNGGSAELSAVKRVATKSLRVWCMKHDKPVFVDLEEKETEF